MTVPLPAVSIVAFAGGGIIAVRYSPTINLGAIILGALVALGTIVGLIYGIKRKAEAEASTAVAQRLREALDDEIGRADRAEKRLDEAVAERVTFEREQAELRHALKNELATANLRTDQTLVLKALTETQRSLAEASAQQLEAIGRVASMEEKQSATLERIATVLERNGSVRPPS